jgi:hypothetical protein
VKKEKRNKKLMLNRKKLNIDFKQKSKEFRLDLNGSSATLKDFEVFIRRKVYDKPILLEDRVYWHGMVKDLSAQE